jgi:hypothetical protein
MPRKQEKLPCIRQKLWYNTIGDTMNRENIEKIAHSSEDRMLLAKVWDKIQSGIRRNIPSNTAFLSPRELDMTRYLFGDLEGLSPSAAMKAQNGKCYATCRIIWMK